MPDYTDEDQEYPGNPSRDLAAEPPPEEAIARAPITAPGVINRGVVNPGNWVYASSRYADQPPVQFPDQPPSQGPFPYGVNRFDLPNGVTAFHVSEDYRQKQFDLAKEAQAARIAAEHAAQDAQMFQQMSRVAMSLKDISEARRQIDIMGLQRDIQNGIPIHEAVARHPMGLGAGYGNALRATATIAPPTKLEIPGMPPAVMANGRPYWPPQGAGGASGTVRPEIEIAKDPSSGKRIGLFQRTGPNSWHFTPDPSEAVLKPGDEIRKYNAIQRGLLEELKTIDAASALSDPSNPRHQYYLDKQAKLKSLTEQIEAIGTQRPPVIPPISTNAAPADVSRTISAPASGVTGRINPLPSSKSDMVKNDLYDVNGVVYRWSGTNLVKVATR